MMYRIQEVSNRIEVPVSTVRYWQKEFSEFIKPEKTNGGQRRYSEEDIDALLRIKDLLHKNKKSVARAKVVLRNGNPETGKTDWQNQKILITGGSGFWGRHFCKTMLEKYKPQVIRIFSRDELKHRGMCKELGNKYLRYFIGDVREADRLRRAMEGCDLVIHAAALKQTFSCDYNPFEAVKTNIHGAQNVIDAAIDAGVKKVIALSTVKAVNPLDLYGSTKLCAEKLFIQGNSYSKVRGTKFSCIRYASIYSDSNDLFSHTSTYDSEPIVSDQRMTQFWIKPVDAVEYIVKAFEQMHGGEIFVPLVPSIKLVDIAKTLGRNIENEETRLKPKEKLHEVLITEEEGRNTIRGNGMYIILQNYSVEKIKLYQNAKKVANGFTYTSDSNDDWLPKEKLAKTLINN